MRYSDRGQLTEREAAELREKFLAAQQRDTPRPLRHFAPPTVSRRSAAWQWLRPVLIGGAWTAGVVVVVALVILWATVAVRAHRQWVDSCHAQGGHVTSTSDTRVGTAIVNGKVTTVITTDTTHYCLADGGRVLGIRS